MELTEASKSPKKGKRKSVGKSPKNVRPENGKKVTNSTDPPTSGCLEGMSAAELTMVRRLAGNDAIVRKKTFKKLRKWLCILAQKVPDSPGKLCYF